MAQPQAYDRATDFTDREGDDTNHAALNAELDAAALSINQIRTNLAQIQRDDGALVNGIVTADSLDDSAFDAVQASVNQATQDAQAAAQSALTSALTATQAASDATSAIAVVQAAQNATQLNATNAAASASAASTSATNAAASATAASNSASAASTSASNAAASQSAAATSATNAAASATTATNQATTATTQAGIATSAATSAGNSATAAAASATSAANSLDEFDDRYLGAKASDPTVDNDGNALLTGALYWNTGSSLMRVYTGSAWVDMAQGVSTPFQTFSGTGAQTAFTLSGTPGSLGSLEVFISGVRQVPTTNYTISGTTLTFVTAPPLGTNNIFVRWISTQAINVPALGSVGTGQIADASVTTAKIAPTVLLARSLFVKTDPTTVAFTKTGANTVSIKAGTLVDVGGALITFASATAVTMPTLTPGEDYAIWCTPAGALQATADPFSSPAAPPVAGARKIGGFHYGLVAPGTTVAGGSFATTGFTNQGGSMTWAQPMVDRIAGINEYSLWDLAWRCKGQQRGMALDPQAEVWHAIYFCSVNHITNGISRNNTDVASGTVLPRIPLAYGGNGSTNYGRLSQYECEEIAASFGLRLPTPDEFRSAAFGVTEAQSLGGAAVTIPLTTRQPGYTSRIGLEQATGHHWIFARGNSAAGGSAWTAGPNRGGAFGNPFVILLGGTRDNAANSGSRASNSAVVAWLSDWPIGLRAAGDHLKHV